MTRALEQMPLYFIENCGQLDSRVAYYVQGRESTLYFTADGMTLVKTEQRHERDDSRYRLEKAFLRRGIPHSPDSGSRWVVKLDFVGANPNPKIEAADPTPAVISYFKGPKENWQSGLSTYGSIAYSNLWPGIDLVYSGTANRLKYTFLVRPGADPAQVRLAYRGARDVRLNDAGQLEVETPAGVLRDDRPYAYQEVEGQRVEIGAGYSLDGASADGSHRYGFALGSYDRSKPLVLDPAVFVYAGYIGGSGGDSGRGIAVDSSGNAYVTGETSSTEATFPVTVGPDLTHNGGAYDAFVAKVKADGTALVYCGYIGGSGDDVGNGIAVDSSGAAYVTGRTFSTEATFPVTVGPDLTHNGGAYDAFVAKVNAAGTALVYCGYIGGSGEDYGNGIAADSSGNAYVTGQTNSNEATFPVTVGPDLTHNGGFQDVFVAKVNAAGTALVYCGYIGGSGDDRGFGIAVESSGNAYITGITSSTEATFPVTVGPDLTYNGGDFFGDAFVAKVNAAGTALVYCGYIGGSGDDVGFGIAVDSSGDACVTGQTNSTEATFPVTVGPDLTYNGGTDAFVAKVNAAGTALIYCGYIGGSGDDVGFGIAVDSSGNAYVTGYTNSTEATFPVTVGPDLTYNGGTDAFVAKVNAVGTALAYCGYIGGGIDDYGRGIAVDSSGNAYVTGYTASTESTFPVTVGPDLTHNGLCCYDAFVAKIGADAQPAGLVEDAHATGATISNVNSVLEPGETVLVNPSWKNIGASPLALTGTASDFTGPAGATYTLFDTAAGYGTIAPGATADSFTAGGPSYRLSVSNPVTRPAAHWDATFLETLSNGVTKTWTLHVGQSFSDVPVSGVFYPFVENIFHNGITAGCGGGNYCPASNVTRWQAAVFLATAMVGSNGTVPVSGTVPSVGSYNCIAGGNSLFGDVLPTDGGCPSIHYIYAQGITAGCGGGNYCPASNVTRWQAAVFLATAMVGPNGTVPVSGTVPSVGSYNCIAGGNSLFGDVLPTDGGCRFIHYIYANGVTAGCGGGNYCPASFATRWQMAIFLVRAFHMPFLQ